MSRAGFRDVARWPGWLVFLVMAAAAAALAWTSFDLLRLAMANRDLVAEHGLAALADGGLAQALEIALRGLIALICYLVFKTAEVELVARWRRPGG
ncbi:MAG: hypothetical protein JNK46_14655 [Methylobacteriaceae bacterium]|nr:hypothetical protein [Methylobacteriaceae bacterium]